MHFYLLLFTLFFLFVILVVLYKWYFAQKYTRERFAFYSIWLFSGFTISLIGLLLVRNQALDFFVSVLNEGGAQIKEYGQVDFYPTAGFILLCILLFYLLINRLHQNWDGVKSTRQVDLVETNRRVSILEDFQFYRSSKDQIQLYIPQEKAKPEVFSPYEPDNRPWHLKAANLFTLLDQQYHINVDKDWYREYGCFIAHYGQNKARVGILCLDKRPSEERLRDFFDFVDKREGKFEKLIVAIAGKGPASTGAKMGRELQTRFEAELLDELISLEHYRDFIEDYFETNPLELSGLTMNKMYVPLGGHQVSVEKGKLTKDAPIKSVEAHILHWAKGYRTFDTEQLAILGEYGQGKTVLLHKIVYEMLRDREAYPRIPILIELRGLSPRNDDELGIFSHWANRFNAKAAALWELHRAGKLLLILDGFDEMDLVGDTEMLFSHFAQLWALARVPKTQIIIAGRPNLFADDEQRRRALGIIEPRVNLPYAQAIYLDKLQAAQIEQMLSFVKPTTQQGILEALKNADEHSSFAEIITRPSTLFQLSTIWDHEMAKKQDRLNSATVIGSFIDKTYERQQSKGDTVLTTFERSYFMQGIAVAMMLNDGYSNQIKHKNLQQIVTNLWNHYPPQLPPYRDAMQGNRYVAPLPERMKENKDALETILKDVRAGGILVQDLSGRDVFKFAHKSYLEYLVSAFYSVFCLQNEEDRSTLMIVNTIAKAHKFTDSRLKGSTDVENFVAEMIAAQIELKDQTTQEVMPVHGNEAKFERALFKKLIIKSYPQARWFPQSTIWLSLHPHINAFLGIGLAALSSEILLIILSILKKAPDWQAICVYLNCFLYLCWGGMVQMYFLKKRTLDYQRVDYLSKFRLYLRSCQLLSCPPKKISQNSQLLIHQFDRQDIFQSFRLVFLAMVILFTGVISGSVIIGVTFVSLYEGVLNPLFVIAFIALMGFAMAYLSAGAGAKGVTSSIKIFPSVEIPFPLSIVTVFPLVFPAIPAYAVISTGASVFVKTSVGVFAGAAALIIAILYSIIEINRNCNKALEKLKTEFEEGISGIF